MHTLKAFIRLTIGLLMILFWCLVYILSILPVCFSHKWVFKFRSFYSKQCFLGICKLIGFQVKVTGDKLSYPYFVASNHVSYMDIISLSLLSYSFFVAKIAIRSWPILGWLVSLGGTIFIDRLKRRDVLRVNKLIHKHMRSYSGITIFPESTTSNGKDILPFYSALFSYPIEHPEIPLYTIVIKYTSNNQNINPSQDICYWGKAILMPHLFNLLKYSGHTAHIYVKRYFGNRENRKQLAKLLHIQAKTCFDKL